MLTSLFSLLFLFGSSLVQAQSCDDGYEVAMLAHTAGLPKVDMGDLSLSTRCIESSMIHMESLAKANGGRFRPFAYCKDDMKYDSSSKPLCRTESMVTGVQDIFQLTMDCLEIPPKALFPLLNIESGFFPNALAPGGDDAGIGQVTPIAATDVNNYWGWLEAHVHSSSRDSCKAIAPRLAALKVADVTANNYVCHFISPEANPLRNSVYAGFFFLVNSKYFHDFFLENHLQHRLSILLGRPFTAAEEDQLTHLLNVSSYNRGFTEISTHLLNFLKNEEDKAQLDWAQIDTVSNTIVSLEKNIQDAKDSLNFELIQSLRLALEMERGKYNELILKRKGKTLEFSVFHYRNSKRGSFVSYLKQHGSARYLDLVLRRMDSIENKLGAGKCGEFENVPASGVLQHMIW